MILDINVLGVYRDKIINALTSEGLDGLTNGYVNVHLLPIFQNKIAYGSKGFPWVSDFCDNKVSYEKGICPIAEELHENSFMGFEMCLYDLEDEDIDLIVTTFEKVWSNLQELS